MTRKLLLAAAAALALGGCVAGSGEPAPEPADEHVGDSAEPLGTSEPNRNDGPDAKDTDHRDGQHDSGTVQAQPRDAGMNGADPDPEPWHGSSAAPGGAKP